jgi:diguanylate cyclase (GGDEF)-like protein
VIPTPVAATSTQTLSPTAPTSSGTSSQPQQLTTLNLPTLATGLGALRQIHVKSTKRSSAGTVISAAGTGAVTFAAGPTGSATPTAGTAVAAAPTGSAAATHTGSAAKPRSHKPAPASGSSLPSPISSSVKYITQFVNVIPTAVWMALGAAFALALAFAALALRSSRRARRREREFVAISAAAATDALTGILNRRGFMDAAERELARASRYDRPFVLAYVDVRGLKAVNDTEGHLMGDELIQAVAGLMKESARADDVVGRIGGDEFALLLDEQTAESAAPVVRRIQARVEERRAAMEIRVPWELTIGIAAFPSDGTTLEELLGTADRRLYEQRGIALR